MDFISNCRYNYLISFLIQKGLAPYFDFLLGIGFREFINKKYHINMTIVED